MQAIPTTNSAVSQPATANVTSASWYLLVHGTLANAIVEPFGYLVIGA